jgi:predicted nucleic acid-binding protein
VPGSAADIALDRMLRAQIRFHASRELVSDATRIARHFGWAKTYDAEYVALANRPGAFFVTTDIEPWPRSYM